MKLRIQNKAKQRASSNAGGKIQHQYLLLHPEIPAVQKDVPTKGPRLAHSSRVLPEPVIRERK